MVFYNEVNLHEALSGFKGNFPFDHCVVDGFLKPELAKQVESEFIDYEDSRWFCYKNAIEDKKALNDWNVFPGATYKLFSDLISDQFIAVLSKFVGVRLYRDPGLHGGGWHIHGTGGNLNPHYDYNIHPKMGLQRKINIIVYLSDALKDEHGGHLGLWTHDEKTNSPAKLVKEVQPEFNRAVIFDTTQDSWHGMCRPLIQPHGIYRKSLAVYYLTDPPVGCEMRERALFAPREEQRGDKSVEDLIKKRADSSLFSSVYRNDESDS